jgi:7,8-dihydropterin-6-yl-methyl-4-(beta-D-ribofuranosyl)aminobenzene 5'-phosphate synthase
MKPKPTKELPFTLKYPYLKKLKMIRITVINDNLPGSDCGAEHGLCFLIEAGISFLFDTGPSDIILKNAETLGIKLDEIPMIVLSHGHYDHTGGLPWLGGQKLICHPAALEPKYRKSDGTWIGTPISAEAIHRKFKVTTSKEPLWLSDKIVFLGEIPLKNDFEAQTTAFAHADGSDDFMPDDSGIAIIGDEGLIVISGCAHSGICNMVDHATAVTGNPKINVVMGGFHLKEDDDVTRKTIECLKALGVAEVYPSHCTAEPAQQAFARHWRVTGVRSGMVLTPFLTGAMPPI